MVDAWLLILTIAGTFFTLITSLYLFFIYSHPAEDKKSVILWFARLVTISGQALILAFILLLTLDTSNARLSNNKLNTALLYEICFILQFIYLIVLIPFTILLYESDEEKPLLARILSSACMILILGVIVTVFALIAFFALNKGEYGNITSTSYSTFTTSEAIVPKVSQNDVTDIEFKVPAFLFMIVFWIFAGWWVFVCFAGIGLIALPLDMILDYFYRPRPRPAKEIAGKIVMLRRRAKELFAMVKIVSSS